MLVTKQPPSLSLQMAPLSFFVFRKLDSKRLDGLPFPGRRILEVKYDLVKN
jgi:hypothetical protein